MANAVPVCTHVKTDGIRCGSPAVSGTELCYHHSAVKTQLGKMTPLDQVSYGVFTPIPFLFPEDRASLQINYFLLCQALMEQRVERRAADLMFRMLREMGRNLGKTGSLVEEARTSEPTSQKRDPSASSGQAVGHPHPPVSEEAASGDEVSVQASINATAKPSAEALAAAAKHEARVGRPLNEQERQYFGLSAPAKPSEALRMGSLSAAGQKSLDRYFGRPLDDRGY